MLGNKAMRLVAVVAVGLGSVGLNAPGAQAAALSGTIAGGTGGPTCTMTVTCRVFTTRCAMPPANDVDASIREVPGGIRNQWMPVTWSTPTRNQTQYLGVEFYNGACQQISSFTLGGNGAVFVPPDAVFVAVLGRFSNAALAWTIA